MQTPVITLSRFTYVKGLFKPLTHPSPVHNMNMDGSMEYEMTLDPRCGHCWPGNPQDKFYVEARKAFRKKYGL